MKRVLIVDDSQLLRLTIKRILQDSDVQVFEAENGQDALNRLPQWLPLDVILLDWRMPLLDGMSFLATLRKNQVIQQPKIIMCTSEGDEAHIREAMQHGADDYIAKPFTQQSLRDKLHEAGVL